MASVPVQSQQSNNFGTWALQTASAIVGPSTTNELTVVATGLTAFTSPDNNIPSGFPWVLSQVFLQPRQSVQQDFGYTDEFTTQFIQWNYVPEVMPAVFMIKFRVMRVDILLNNPAPGPQGGWGQDLQVDIMLITVPGS
jgi:hypothetical protein